MNMSVHASRGMQPLPTMQNLQNRTDQMRRHEMVPTTGKVMDTRVNDGFGHSRTEKQPSKAHLMDPDSRIARIDQMLQNQQLTPPKLESRWKIMGKVAGKMLLSVPKVVVSVLKNVLKVGVQPLRLLTFPLKKLGDAIGGTTQKVLSQPEKTFAWKDGYLEQLGSGINKSYDKIFKNCFGINLQLEDLNDGAKAMVAEPVGGVANWMGTNIFGDGTTNQPARIDYGQTNNPSSPDHTSGADGAMALHLGAPMTAFAAGLSVDQMSGALSDLEQGMSLQARAQQLSGQHLDGTIGGHEAQFLRQQGRVMEQEARNQYFTGLENLEMAAVGGTNQVFGSGYMNPVVGAETATAITNVTQVAGTALFTAVCTTECVISSVQASKAKGRMQACDEFLDKTAVLDNGSLKVASKDTDDVRESVKAYKQNQKQTRKLKIFNASSNAMLGVAGAVAIGLMVVAVANPIGLIAAGVALGVGAGVAAYRGYKVATRKSQIKGLEQRADLVQRGINAKMTEARQKLALPDQASPQELAQALDQKRLAVGNRQLDIMHLSQEALQLEKDLGIEPLRNDLRRLEVTFETLNSDTSAEVKQMSVNRALQDFGQAIDPEASLQEKVEQLRELRTGIQGRIDRRLDKKPEDLVERYQQTRFLIGFNQNEMARETRELDDITAVMDDLQSLHETSREIERAQIEASPQLAAAKLLHVLNHGDEAGKEAARVALNEVFRMNPVAFELNEDGEPLVAPETHELAKAQLAKKMNLFHASVFANG